MSFDWNDRNIQHLRDMWEKGLSASLIAQAIGCQSRNAVIGKASRLGLMGRASPIKRGAAAKYSEGQRARYERRDEGGALKVSATPRAVAAKPGVIAGAQTWSLKTRVEAPAPRPAPILPTREPKAAIPFNGNPVTLLLVGAGQCRWPVSDGRLGAATLCCGAPVAVNACRPFCAHHTDRARGKPAQEPGNLAAIDNWASAARRVAE